ncbi:MAG: RluA family pseudouridine synthase [Bacteroidales bacterium]|nr:RluA family pseudouridine synthase [Bacteroidales bacterium]MCK9499955.1 RluA family pseudouridine synthase [Bacteroidales bacterium]NLB86254.1 RluA family pseudouridine synthase [Bacteroidales bacterium]
MEIIYEDNHIIAINKKASQIVQGDKTGDKPLSELVKEYLKVKYNKQGNVYLGVPHRLDRPVSGVVLFAKTSKSLTRLNEIFRLSQAQKTYYAIVANPPKHQEDKLIDYIYRNRKQNKSYIVEAENKTAKKAILDYKLIAKSERYYLLEINLITGRHHQIRVQLSNMDCPIRGDLKYGYPRSNDNANINLHSREISFIHPVKNEKISIIAPFPEDKIWTIFGDIK